MIQLLAGRWLAFAISSNGKDKQPCRTASIACSTEFNQLARCSTAGRKKQQQQSQQALSLLCNTMLSLVDGCGVAMIDCTACKYR